MKHKTRAPGAAALVGSLAVHAGIAAWVMTREAPERKRAPEPVEIEIAVSVEAPVLPAEPPAAEAPAQVAVVPNTKKPTRTEKHAAASETRAAEAAAAVAPPAPSEMVVLPTPPSSSQPVVLPAPRKLDLSPLAAALTMRDTFARTSCGTLTGGGACEGASGHDAGVAHAAPDERAALIALRKELKLTPQPDGSYSYDNASFHASVQPDGRVLFEDKVRDLNSLVERMAGTQVNTAEKRRFMQSTAALREQLASATEAQNQQRAKHTLRATLDRLWRDAALSLVQKRAAVFGLWDDCASDASGSAAQAAIEGFVRQHMPEGTPLAYSSAELALLNRRRVSRRAFDPYAAADAGAQPG